jgi:hypothetical protein
MENNNQQLFVPEPTLLNLLDLHTTSSTSFLTSTKNHGLISVNHPLNINRRKAIIPTPHRPTLSSHTAVKTNSKDEPTLESKSKKISSSSETTGTRIENIEFESNQLISKSM